ncbi:MAG: hypothetical protein IPL98_06570 [Saprospiraceae bacterium]|nr:hypothetical protein [Saprospiraceae bacterium]
MRYLFTVLLFAFFQLTYAQTLQLKFCGKNSKVNPVLDGNGQDQRHKGQITLDYIKVGIIGQSATNPVYVLGEPTTTHPATFANATFVDGCATNRNFSTCAGAGGCTTCKSPYYGNNISVGTFEGRMLENARILGANNNLYIQSIGDTNLVCYITNKIDLTAQRGKTIEITIKYSGNSTDGFSTRNINLQHQFNNANWPASGQVFNKNSNNTIEHTETWVLGPAVATEDLTDITSLQINPNLVNDVLRIEMGIEKPFNGSLSILNELGSELLNKKESFHVGNASMEVPVEFLSAGLYILKIADESGRIKTARFTKF